MNEWRWGWEEIDTNVVIVKRLPVLAINVVIIFGCGYVGDLLSCLSGNVIFAYLCSYADVAANVAFHILGFFKQVMSVSGPYTNLCYQYKSIENKRQHLIIKRNNNSV